MNTKVNELTEEIERLNKEKERLQDNLSFLIDKEFQLDIITNALFGLKTYFKEMTVPENPTLIKLLVQKIEWDGRDLHIIIYGE